MRKIDLAKRAQRFLDRLPPKHRRQLSVKVHELRTNPTPQDASLLKGSSYWRADSGEYRIIYRFDDETVFVTDIGKRNDDEIYRQFDRRR
jgi:mRNA interferase RelE/StbE